MTKVGDNMFVILMPQIACKPYKRMSMSNFISILGLPIQVLKELIILMQAEKVSDNSLVSYSQPKNFELSFGFLNSTRPHDKSHSKITFLVCQLIQETDLL